MRDVASSLHHSLHPLGTPSLLPIPPLAPSASRRAEIPKADTPPRKRLLLTTPRPSCEVGESSAAAAARQPGPTMAHRVDYSLVDTMETRFRDTERRMMTAVEMVNMRDRAAVRAKIEDFKGTEGVVGLTRWFEKMEYVFSISNCTVASQVKFATCTLQDDALTWWNSQVKTTTPEAAHAMPWVALKKMMTDKYWP
ncbi:hypothetical protein Tco_0192200, partial [Tanacetum coccineum]